MDMPLNPSADSSADRSAASGNLSSSETPSLQRSSSSSVSNPNSLSIPSTSGSPLDTHVILVRHGRSTFNDQGRYQGCNDTATLTEKGRQTAYRVGKALKSAGINAIYASPLKRVQETVDEILVGMGQCLSDRAIYNDDRLREIDLPAWEGLTIQQVRDQFAEDYRCWKQHPHAFRMVRSPHSDSIEFPVLDLYQRAQLFWQQVLPRHAGQTILIVSHAGTNHALISTALGLSAQQHHTLQQSNCGISVLTFSPSALTNGAIAQASLQSLNVTHHLGETEPKLKEGKRGLRLLLAPVVQSPHQGRQLVETVRSIHIDFSLSTDTKSTHRTLAPIAHQHPHLIQLHAQRDDFLQVWQQTIQAQRLQTADPQTTPSAPMLATEHLTTGLVVATEPQIQQIVGLAIGLTAAHYTKLHLQPGTISVLHYPIAHQHPILQSLNFGTLFPAIAQLSA